MNRRRAWGHVNLSNTRRAVFGLLALFAFCVGAQAAPITWGAEFELARWGVRPKDFNKAHPARSAEKGMQLDYVRALSAKCEAGDCTIRKVNGKWDDAYQVMYPDGWWILVDYDPGCVEITFKPSTLDELRLQSARINRDIFGLAPQAGLGVRTDKNSHVNFGAQSAFDDPQELLRFFIDYANHPELAVNTLGVKDFLNAPPLAALKPEQRTALTQLARDVKAWSSAPSESSIGRLTRAIMDRIYTSTYVAGKAIDHYQAVGIKYLLRLFTRGALDRPMELRSVRIQDSAERFIHVAELLEARIAYLKRRGDGPYSEIARTDFDPVERKTRFAIYVMETGESFEKFADLLPDDLKDVPLDAILDPHASREERRKSAERYADLLPSSPWLREQPDSFRMRGETCREIFSLTR